MTISRRGPARPDPAQRRSRTLPTRTLLEHADTQDAITTALARIDPAADLREADQNLFAAMEYLWSAIWNAWAHRRRHVRTPWVTVSKLCARKRPALFPVRDSVVCEGLGVHGTKNRPRGNYRQLDWQVFQHLITHPGITTALDELEDRVRDRHGFRCDRYKLRTPDIAYGAGSATSGEGREHATGDVVSRRGASGLTSNHRA